MNNSLRDHTHLQLNQEVTAIGGHYVLTKEESIPYNGRKVLYVLGYAMFDTTCCGSGGCSYAIVPGFIENWKIKKNEEGSPISEVEPITDPNIQKEIRLLIEKRETVTQVNFH